MPGWNRPTRDQMPSERVQRPGVREQSRFYISIVTGSSTVELSGSRAPTGDDPLSLLTAVADPIRWTVLRRLVAGQACVCALQEEVPVAPNLLSYHLKVLRDAGLVISSRRGRWIDYRLADDALPRLINALPISKGDQA